jgi:hypothetical protein
MNVTGLATCQLYMPKARSRTMPEVRVADRDRVLRAPALPHLLARGEEVDVALERRLERLVPVLQVREQRQRARLERVQPGPEGVGVGALVDEKRHLRLAHRELGAVLDLHVLHGHPVGEHPIAVLRPVDDVDELLAEEVREGHGRAPVDGVRAI